MSTEEMYIQHIENGIRSILNGSKSAKEANVGMSLNKLKDINIGMYEDYLKKYKEVLANRK
jgi:hypothetical protein